MGVVISRLLVFLLFWGNSVVAWAKTDLDLVTNREIAHTYANYHLQRHEYSDAVKVLNEYLKDDPQDATTLNFLGLVYLEQGRNGEAASMFYKAAELIPTSAEGNDRGIFLYNYADALARGRSVNLSKQVLLHAQRYEALAASARRARQTVMAGRPLPPLELTKSGYWILQVSLGGGYDTNVLLASDASVATLSASDTASPVGLFSVQGGYQKPIWNGELQARMSGSGTKNFNVNAERFNSASGGAFFGYIGDSTTLHAFSNAFENQFTINYLNSDGMLFYNWTDTPKWTLRYRHGDKSESRFSLSAPYSKFRVDTGDDPKDDRTGLSGRPGIGTSWGSGENRLSADLFYEYHKASGMNYVAHTFELPLTWSRPLFWKLLGILEVGPSLVSYPKSKSLRKDQHLDIGYTLVRAWNSKLTTSLLYKFSKNYSNVDTARYTKHLGLLMVTYDIF